VKFIKKSKKQFQMKSRLKSLCVDWKTRTFLN